MGDSSLSGYFNGPTNSGKIIQQRSFDIPSDYNDNKITLMVRDPWTLFTYWEVKKDVESKVRQEISSRGLTVSKSILRVYEVEEASAPVFRILYDFELRNWANSWYIHTQNPGKKWKVEIGIICTNGEFFCLAASNIVETPFYGMSDICDDKWMCSEDQFYKLFGIAGGHGIGRSSMEMKEVLERHLRSWLSSGGITSGMFGSASFFLQRKESRPKEGK